ncbi:flagellar biosynthetic protein FliQ [Spirochaetia bacterium]|nr:flagellar biosynthetic protein FliQ [Spirochaetia bacterium]
MSIGDIVLILRGGILQIIILAAPVLLTALAVGLVIAIIQAATQIQEQTLTFVPKVLAILLMIFLLGGWMFTTLGNYTTQLFRMIPQLAG